MNLWLRGPCDLNAEAMTVGIRSGSLDVKSSLDMPPTPKKISQGIETILDLQHHAWDATLSLLFS